MQIPTASRNQVSACRVRNLLSDRIWQTEKNKRKGCFYELQDYVEDLSPWVRNIIGQRYEWDKWLELHFSLEEWEDPAPWTSTRNLLGVVIHTAAWAIHQRGDKRGCLADYHDLLPSHTVHGFFMSTYRAVTETWSMYLVLHMWWTPMKDWALPLVEIPLLVIVVVLWQPFTKLTLVSSLYALVPVLRERSPHQASSGGTTIEVS